MNHIYQLVWNEDSGQCVPAPECAKRRGKSKRHSGKPATVLLTGTLLGALALPALAQSLAPDTLPTGGQVASGQATIGQSGNQMTIQQGTDKAILHWQGFDIGSQANVTFQQPSASAVALNRVLAGDASRIEGALSANGQVWLVNPAGVIFGQGARVNVGGLVASTLDTRNDDFLNGRMRFSRNGAAGAIENHGEISAADGGLVALLAPQVRNEGVIQARLGSVVLAAGDAITLETGADGHLQVALDPATVHTLIENRQLIIADGGEVVMTSAAADALASGIIGNSGTVQARTLQEKDGRILLLADMRHGEVQAAGQLQAKFVETSAAQVGLDQNLSIDTQGGEWLIDPTDITIDSAKAAAIQTALGSGNVTVTTADSGDNTGWGGGSNPGAGGDAGDIYVNAGISWSQYLLTLNADRNIHINAELTASNTAGLALEYGQGNVSAGNTAQYIVRAPVNLASTGSFSTKLGSDGAVVDYTILTTLGSDTDATTGADTLQGIAHASMLGGHYVLGADIDAGATSGWNSGAGFAPVGDDTNKFIGTLDGLGHQVSNLSILQSAPPRLGLFGFIGTSGQVQNIGVSNASIQGVSSIGLLAGFNEGSIANSWSSGTISANGGGRNGGLVGGNNGTIRNSWSIANVADSGGSSGGNGGLVGYNYNLIENSYATGNVSGYAAVGGLVGGNVYGGGSNGTIKNSFASGSISAGQSSTGGGLVGNNWSGALIQNSYSASTSNVALVGYAGNSGNITNSFWDKDIGGSSGSYGTGKTTTEMKSQATFAGWDFGNVWQIYEGDSYPVLRGLQHSVIVAVNNDSKIYDGNAYNSNNGYTATAGVTLTGMATWGGNSQGAVNGGTYGIGITGGLSIQHNTQQDYQNWGGILYVDGVLTITPAPLTITANDASKTYDGAAWSGGNGVQYAGFVNGEDESVLSGALSYGGTSQGAMEAGGYAITPQGLSALNYNLSFVDGLLTIRPMTSSPDSSGSSGMQGDDIVHPDASRIGNLSQDGFALGAVFGPTAAGWTDDSQEQNDVENTASAVLPGLTFAGNGANADGLRNPVPYLDEEEDFIRAE